MTVQKKPGSSPASPTKPAAPRPTHDGAIRDKGAPPRDQVRSTTVTLRVPPPPPTKK